MLDDEPLPLATACQLFPHAKLTPSTLRAEAQRGRLEIFRLGKRDCTTKRAMQEMIRKCQDAGRDRGSTSTKPADNGLSETDQILSAQAALNTTVIALKRGLPSISGKNTNPKSVPAR